MKKYLILIVLVLLFSMIGCSDKKESDPIDSDSNSVISQKIDSDLTKLSDIMLLAEVNNMIMQPDKYLGQTIKVRGNYYISELGDSETIYHLVLIPDSTGCCYQGFEFVWEGNHTYPEEETEIIVTGVYSMAEDEDSYYYYLQATDVSFK